jgi:glutathione S-transferase
MKLTAWVTLVAIALYFWTGINAARARIKCKVKAPSMDGPLEFQSCVRVQMNTLEQLPMLLAPMWMCAYFLGDRWAAAGGLLWCAGRLLYALAYYKDPSKRSTGFTIGVVASMLLLVGTVAGLLMP